MGGIECHVSEIYPWCMLLSLLLPSNILRIYNLFIHSSVNEHLGCFHIGTGLHKDTVNNLAQVFVDLYSNFSWVIIWKRNCHTVFQSNRTILYYQQCMSFSWEDIYLNQEFERFHAGKHILD